MSLTAKVSVVIWATISSVFIIACNQLYKAGNLVGLRYPIETSLNSDIIERYLDTLIQKRGYGAPESWMHYDKLINLDSVNNKRVYFKDTPEEMYLLSFGGMLVLSDVYNQQIKKNDWVAERSLISTEQEQRIKLRLRKEILDQIEAMAKRDGLPDSVIYNQK